jgi:hypothetical protein
VEASIFNPGGGGYGTPLNGNGWRTRLVDEPFARTFVVFSEGGVEN